MQISINMLSTVFSSKPTLLTASYFQGLVLKFHHQIPLETCVYSCLSRVLTVTF